MHIIVDFDYTLYDTHAMRAAVIDALSGYGVTKEQYDETELTSKENGLYDIDVHLRSMLPEAECASARVIVEKVISSGEQFLYSDATSFLERHSGHETTLLSFGYSQWQELKVNGSGIAGAVHDMVLTPRPKEEELHRFSSVQEIAIINDRGSEIDAMHAVRPDAQYIHVQRPGTPYVGEPSQHATHTVANLSFDLPL